MVPTHIIKTLYSVVVTQFRARETPQSVQVPQGMRTLPHFLMFVRDNMRFPYGLFRSAGKNGRIASTKPA